MITLTLLFIAWVAHLVTGNFIFGGIDSLEKMALCALVSLIEISVEACLFMCLSDTFMEYYAERRRKELEKCRRY